MEDDGLGTDNEGFIVVGGNNKNINVWSIKTGEHKDTLQGHTDSVTCMAMERKFLFTGSDDMTIIIWNMLKGNRFMVGKLEGHKECNYYLIIHFM